MLCFAADLGRSARWPIASSWRRSANEIAESPFVGEGHRKIRARLALRGIHTSGKRVLRLTRGAGLLAPTPQVRKRSKRLHDAKITVEVPDTLWATDATEGHTRHDGRCAVFAIIDHASGEAWVDAAARMDRWAAADLLRGAHHRALRLGRAGRRRRPGAALRRRARASALITSRPRSTTSASPAARPSTTSPRPTAASRSSSRRSRNKSSGSSASTRSSSYAPASAASPPTTTSTGCSNATATAPPPKPTSVSSITPRWHDRHAHQQSVR